jgi:ferric-dicitrate binding protein FerR (iron transport regulator)
VPKMFGIELRAVKIDGTANFDVTRTPEQALQQAFEVRSSNVVIQAKGTSSFTVRRYKEDKGVVVHAKRGPIDVRVGENTRTVAEGSSIKVDTAGTMEVPTSEEVAEASSWADGKASILGKDLREALPLLKRWYGLDIHVEDQALLARKVFINADITSKKAAIAAVEQSGGMRFTYIGENMAFQDTLPSRGRRTKRP